MNPTVQAQWLKQLPPWLYKLGAQSYIDYQYPRHLFIETTAACNLTCSYCPRERVNSHMDFQVLRRIVDEATSYGPRSFSLHLFGEPLLYKQWEQAVAYIKSRDHRHTVLLTTNGTLIERGDTLGRLVGSEIDQVYWTWRPEAKFTQETKGKLRRWGKFRVRFIREVTPPEAYEEWSDWPNVEGRKLHNYGGNIQTERFGTERSVRNASSFTSENLSTQLNVSSANGNSRWACYHLWLAPAVAWNGNILLCCADSHQKEVIGQFPQMSVHEAWTGGRIKSVRDGHMKGEYLGICKDCDVWKQYPDLFFSWQKKGVPQ